MKCQLANHSYVIFSDNKNVHQHALCQKCGHVLHDIDNRTSPDEARRQEDCTSVETSDPPRGSLTRIS